jgi:hypothetical protein
MEFFREYVGVLPAIVAVVNGLIAVLLSHYPYKTPMAKIAFIVIVLSLSVIAIAATLYSQHLIVAKRAAEQARIKSNRETIGSFILEGNQLLQQAADQSLTPPQDAANDWSARVESFLIKELGTSYVARLRDATAVPGAMSPIGVDSDHVGLWRGIYARLLRLEQFSQEQTPSS